MKNIIKSFILLTIMSLTVTSCLIEDENLTDTFNDGPNFSNFSVFTRNLSAVADGNDISASVVVELQGPTVNKISEDVTVSISVDPSSTAIEGVHFRLNATSVTLTKNNNFIGHIPFTIITEGIVPPLDVAPIIVFKIAETSGVGNIISSSKTAKFSIIYQCFADLTGTYSVTNDFCSSIFTTTITKNSDGSWRVGALDGGFLHTCTSNTTLINGGNMVELCGKILPTGDLDFGTNAGFGIGDVLGGTWNSDTGVLVLQNQDTFFSGGPYMWTSTYIRQ